MCEAISDNNAVDVLTLEMQKRFRHRCRRAPFYLFSAQSVVCETFRSFVKTQYKLTLGFPSARHGYPMQVTSQGQTLLVVGSTSKSLAQRESKDGAKTL